MKDKQLRDKKKFTIIGFSKYNYDDPSNYYHCEIHKGARLLPKPDEKGAWWCPICGTPFRPTEQEQAEVDEEKKVLAAKIDPLHTKPEIISGKSGAMRLNSRKKRYDELGNEINPNDNDIMNDIAQGLTRI